MNTAVRVAMLAALLGGAGMGAPGDAGSPHRATRVSAQERQNGGRHIALLIAVSRYEHFQETGTEPGKSRLRAPVENDLPRMQKSLERWGFMQGADMKVLADSAASRAGIRAAFRWLAARVRDSSDVVVVYYSGHGSWAPDRDGDEAKLDPKDRVDEALVPWDAVDIHDPSQLVIDDEIREWLARLVTQNVTVIVDACFSGTITRGAAASRQRGPVAPPSGGGTQTALDPGNARHTLITAASAGQTASEIGFPTALGDRPFGVLTYFLSRALDAADSSVRYDELIRRVRADVSDLADRIPPQEPQLEGDRAALVFRVRRPFAPRPIANVVAVSAGRLTLDVGAVNDVRVGAVYDVYPPTAVTFDRGVSQPQIEIDSVGRVQAFAHRVTSFVGAAPIALESRALLALVPAGARQVNHVLVKLDPSTPALREVVSRIPFVTVVDSSPDAVLRHADGSARVDAGGVELAPQPNDQLVRSPVRHRDGVAGYVLTTAGLCPPLRRALAIAAIRGVDNPAAPYLPVQLRLVRGNASPIATPTRTVDTVFVGQSYTLWAKVSAPMTSTLFLTVAVSGFASDPSVLYPDAGSAAPVALNSWEPIRSGITVGEPPGRETLRAVVSSRPFDFRPLIDALPRCDEVGARGSVRHWKPSIEPVTGWAAAQRDILILSAVSRPAR